MQIDSMLRDGLAVIGGLYAIARVVFYLFRFVNLDETARVALVKADELRRETLAQTLLVEGRMNELRRDLNTLMYAQRNGSTNNMTNIGERARAGQIATGTDIKQDNKE